MQIRVPIEMRSVHLPAAARFLLARHCLLRVDVLGPGRSRRSHAESPYEHSVRLSRNVAFTINRL